MVDRSVVRHAITLAGRPDTANAELRVDSGATNGAFESVHSVGYAGLGGRTMRGVIARSTLVLWLAFAGRAVAQPASQCPRGTRPSTNSCVAVIVPENAEIDIYGTGWSCIRGYRNSGGRCSAVVIPEHGELDVYGNGWTCERGYRESGGRCVAVVVPANVELDVYGHGWTCQRGYSDAGGRCIAVVVPANAELDVLGHSWTCKRGFQAIGARCVPVVLPDNAELDAIGNSWTCKVGFKRSGSACIAMSREERQRQDQAVARAVVHQRRVSSASCEIDGKAADGIHAEIVFKQMGCDYFVAEGSSGLYVIEWYGGHDPDKGDIIVGPIDSYGFKDVCYAGYGQGHVYVDDYDLSESSAVDKIKDKCH